MRLQTELIAQQEKDAAARAAAAARSAARPAASPGASDLDAETAELLRLQAELLGQQGKPAAPTTPPAGAPVSTEAPPPAGAAAGTPETPAAPEAPPAAAKMRDPRFKFRTQPAAGSDLKVNPTGMPPPRRRVAPTQADASAAGASGTDPEARAPLLLRRTGQAGSVCLSCTGTGICPLCNGSGHEPSKRFCHGCWGNCACSTCAGAGMLT